MVALYRVDFPPGSLGVEIGPSRIDDVIRRPEVFAAIPAPRYSADGPHLFLRDNSRQIQVSSRLPGSGLIFCFDGRSTLVRRGGNPVRGCVAGVQSTDVLIEAGAVVAQGTDDYASRTAVVERRDGGMSFVASRGSSSREFAEEIALQLDGVWAATTSIGDDAVIATNQGVIFGPDDTSADAWLVARLPVVSRAKFSQGNAGLPDIGASPSPERTLLGTRETKKENGDGLRVVVGLTLLAAAVWWYQKEKKRSQ